LRVKVRALGRLTEIIPWGDIELTLEGKPSLEDLLRIIDMESKGKLLKIIMDENGFIKGEYIVLVNGLPVTGRVREVSLGEGDEIVILPPASGGSINS